MSEQTGKKKSQSIETLVGGSFLRHVPELLATGMPMEEAINAAYERDLLMLVEMQLVAERMSSGGYRAYSDKDKAYAALIEGMSRRVYQRLNENQ